jgi:hypothetical protein
LFEFVCLSLPIDFFAVFLLCSVSFTIVN